jgi:DNA-binding protein HU-beta
MAAATKPAAKAQETVTLKQIAAELAGEHELSKKDVEALFEGMITHFGKNLKKGKRIRIKGLGILQVKKTSARTGRNPATGETIQIPAKKKVAFRVAKELKETVL